MKKYTTLIIIGIVIFVGALLFFGKSDTKSIDNTAQDKEEVQFSVGDRFPDFRLSEVSNIAIIPDIFLVDPTIIWFTTSWCVPCQIGARDTSVLDTELGDEAFDVLVIFIDPRESNEDLINWRNQYANPDWLVAFDDQNDSLAQKLDVKFLDTKYLLDENGVIINIDERQVNSEYLDLIREEVNN